MQILVAEAPTYNLPPQKGPLAHPPEPSYPCYVSVLGDSANLAPREEPRLLMLKVASHHLKSHQPAPHTVKSHEQWSCFGPASTGAVDVGPPSPLRATPGRRGGAAPAAPGRTTPAVVIRDRGRGPRCGGWCGDWHARLSTRR